jgi:hypothetical protein
VFGRIHKLQVFDNKMLKNIMIALCLVCFVVVSSTPTFPGGTPTDVVGFPWSSEIFSFALDSGKRKCNGAIVSPTMILTTSACSITDDDYALVVGYGENYAGDIDDYDWDENSLVQSSHEITSVRRYPNFVSPLTGGELTIIVLKNAIELTNKQSPAAIAAPDASEAFIRLQFPAFLSSYDDYGGNGLSARLKVGSFRFSNKSAPLRDQFLVQPNNSICSTNEGGPIIEGKFLQLMGILSQVNVKTNCEDLDAPLVFVRVSSFWEWINRINDILSTPRTEFITFPLASNFLNLMIPEKGSDKRAGPAHVFEVLVARSLLSVEFTLDWLASDEDEFGNPVVQVELEGAQVHTQW